MAGRSGQSVAIYVALACVIPLSAHGKPLRPGDCAAAFNPGASQLVVIKSRHADWTPAWNAALGLRKKKVAAEVVPANLFAAQPAGWLVLLGGAADRAAADKLAAAHPGAEVIEATLAAELHGPPVRPAATLTMPGTVWDVAGDVVTIVEGRDIAIVKPREGGRPPEQIKVQKGALAADVHMAAVSRGDLYVLDEEAHWWRMVDGKPLGPLAAPDVRPPGEATAGDLRFRRQHGPPGARGLVVERAGKPAGLLHLGFLEPFGSDGSIAGLPFAKDGKLTVAYARDLHRFEILPTPAAARLVKLCGKIEASGAGKPGLRPLRVKLAAHELVTGDDGRFETWTAEWGELRLGLAPAKDGVIACGAGKKEYGPWNPGLGGGAGDDPVDVALWDAETTSVVIKVRCGKP